MFNYTVPLIDRYSTIMVSEFLLPEHCTGMRTVNIRGQTSPQEDFILSALMLTHFKNQTWEKNRGAKGEQIHHSHIKKLAEGVSYLWLNSCLHTSLSIHHSSLKVCVCYYQLLCCVCFSTSQMWLISDAFNVSVCNSDKLSINDSSNNPD